MKDNMKVLITGNKGFVGQYVQEKLTMNSVDVVGFDLKDGEDIRDYSSLKEKAVNCDVMIHLAACDNDNPTEIIDHNIVGSMNILNVFRESNIKKLIFMSSVDSLGIFQGEDQPKYLPLEDDYPCHPIKPYSLSKYGNEQMCKYYSSICEKPILCLRAPGIWSEKTYQDILNLRKERASYEWDPYWEYGAFIDVRDLAEAIYLSVIKDFKGYHCHFISSDDITTSGKTGKELVDFLFPGFVWKGDDSYLTSPYKSLLDNQPLKDLLGWEPKYSWKSETQY